MIWLPSSRFGIVAAAWLAEQVVMPDSKIPCRADVEAGRLGDCRDLAELKDAAGLVQAEHDHVGGLAEVPDAVVHRTAEKPVHRLTSGLSDQIPQRKRDHRHVLRAEHDLRGRDQRADRGVLEQDDQHATP